MSHIISRYDTPDAVRASDQAADRSFDLWSSGKHDAAVENLLEEFKRNPISGTEWSWLVATWQLEMGLPDAKIVEMLRQYPSNLPHWHFANALALYRHLGDNAISRAALGEALEWGSSFGWALLGKSESEIEKELRREALELDGEFGYPEKAIKTWTNTEGALEWLDSGFTRIIERAGGVPTEPDSSNKMRHKRWSDNLESALTFIRRKENKQAKNSLLTALKEARHFGVLSSEFERTVSTILLARVGAEAHLEPSLKEQVSAAKSISSTEPLKALRAYVRAAEHFETIKSLSNADDCYSAAVAIMDSLSAEQLSSVDNKERSDLLEASGAYWINEEGLRRSIPLFEKAIELKSIYLGDKHSDLIEPLCNLHECLISLRETKDRAEAVVSRMLAIDPDAREYLEEDHGHLMEDE